MATNSCFMYSFLFFYCFSCKCQICPLFVLKVKGFFQQHSLIKPAFYNYDLFEYIKNIVQPNNKMSLSCLFLCLHPLPSWSLVHGSGTCSQTEVTVHSFPPLLPFSMLLTPWAVDFSEVGAGGWKLEEKGKLYVICTDWFALLIPEAPRICRDSLMDCIFAFFEGSTETSKWQFSYIWEIPFLIGLLQMFPPPVATWMLYHILSLRSFTLRSASSMEWLPY